MTDDHHSRPESDLGTLALRAQSAKLKVLDWMTSEQEGGRYPYAWNAPGWREYREAEEQFFSRTKQPIGSKT